MHRMTYSSYPAKQTTYRSKVRGKWIDEHPSSFVPVRLHVVLTYQGIEDGWETIGERRTAAAAERLLKTLSRVRPRFTHRVEVQDTRLPLRWIEEMNS